ncbi:MAG: TrkA family potassium uptake protein [Candidatus Firestonebacteria bacterium]
MILGCGKVGTRLSQVLSKEGNEVIIIDRDIEAFKQLGEDFKGKTFSGLGIDRMFLKQTGIEKAEVFIAVTNNDNINIMSAQIAKRLFNVPRVIVRIEDPVRAQVFQDLDIETYCPTTVSVKSIHKMLTKKS